MPLSISEIQCCIDALNTSSDVACFPFLSACTIIANTGISMSVSTKNDLPDISTGTVPEGRVVYVDDISTLVVSTRFGWNSIDGRLFRRDLGVENQLWSWGSRNNGGLGNGICCNDASIGGTTSSVREFCSATNWCSISRSGAILALKTDGSLWGWGCSTCGSLGDGTTVPKCSPVREICSATDWCFIKDSLAIKTDGSLWAWGSGACGSSGTGNLFFSSCSPVREASSSTNWCQACRGGGARPAGSGVKTDGTLWTWGNNNYGQLGVGNTSTTCSPVRERCSATNWCQTVAGYRMTGAIKTDGTLWTWGSNTYGQLGIGVTGSCQFCSPVRERCSATNWCKFETSNTSSAAQKIDGTLWGWGKNDCGNFLRGGGSFTNCGPLQITPFTDWATFSFGFQQIAALKTDGTAWAWGRNFCGELGIPFSATNISGPPMAVPVCDEYTSSWCFVSVGATGISAIKVVG